MRHGGRISEWCEMVFPRWLLFLVLSKVASNQKRNLDADRLLDLALRESLREGIVDSVFGSQWHKRRSKNVVKAFGAKK